MAHETTPWVGTCSNIARKEAAPTASVYQYLNSSTQECPMIEWWIPNNCFWGRKLESLGKKEQLILYQPQYMTGTLFNWSCKDEPGRIRNQNNTERAVTK